MSRKRRDVPGESESRKVLRDRIRAWWLAAIAGQVDQSHPIHTDLAVRVEGDTLIITGTVPDERDLREIERETEHLAGHGVAHIRNELKVVPQTTDTPGVLAQTLLAVYDSPEQSGFAAGYLEGHATLTPLLLLLLPPDDRVAARGILHAVLPSDYWPDTEALVTADKALLLVVVDELDAFGARELLEEETSSVDVRVLPPEPISAVETARAALRETASATKPSASRADKREDVARRKTRAAETAIHER